MQKYYCYVDETGQDTKGEFFLVSVVLVEATLRESLKKRLLRLEVRSGKESLKWNGSSFEVRIYYLRGLFPIRELYGCLHFYYVNNSLDYSNIKAHAIVRPLQNITQPYKVTILIDGFLSKKEERIISRVLHKSEIRFRKIRGLKTNDCFMRLADALAGFLRDHMEEQDYTEEIYGQLITTGFLIE